VQEVYGRLVKGQAKSKILRECSELYSVSPRQVENYMAKARKMINDDCDMSRQALLAETLSGIRDVRESANRRGQHQVELNAIRLMTELVGLTSS
jgi:hypothetical protein